LHERLRERFSGRFWVAAMELALAALGFTSVIGQVLLLRELIAVFYGNELVLGLILAIWLVWVALGSWGLGSRLSAAPVARRMLAGGLALMAILLPAQMALARALRLILGITPGAFVDLGGMAWSVCLTLAPLCLLLGLGFTAGARTLAEAGGTAGQAYVWESLGAVAGGALFSFLLVHILDPFQIALGLGVVNLAVATALIRSWGAGFSSLFPAHVSEESKGQASPRPYRVIAWGAAFLLLLIPAWLLGQDLNRATLRWQWTDLVFAYDSAYGRLTVTARDGQRAFFENGLLMFETQGTFPEEVVHFPMLEHPAPRRILLIGGGVAGDLREIFKYPVEHVQYVELDPTLIEAAQTHLPPTDAEVLRDPRLAIAYMDGRLFVKDAGNSHPPQQYDVIILDLPEPSTGQLNRFYTLEFFQEVQRILKPDGVFSLGLPSAENYWSPELARRNGSVYQTLRAVFPSILVLPGDHVFYLASLAPLSDDSAVLAGRLRARQISTRWVTRPYIEYILTTDRYAQARQRLENMAGVKANRDLTPICYYYTLVLWLSLFYSGLGRFFYAPFLGSLVWLMFLASFIGVLLRLVRHIALPGVITLTGFVAMTFEVVILLAFQALHGYVYQQVSLVVAAFMAGLALGGAFANRIIATGLPAARALLLAQGALVAYALLLPTLLSAPLPLPGLVFPALVALVGLLGGMEFPLAVELSAPGTSSARTIGLIYGADLLGGCVGALLGGILLLPLFGVSGACYAVALFSLAGLVALL
jgi:spermidine synthase